MDRDDERPRSVLDEQAAELRAGHRGWRVWYVRSAVTRGVIWSAQPARYPLTAGSADELAEAIDADEAGQ
jgi:hypothetical protein